MGDIEAAVELLCEVMAEQCEAGGDFELDLGEIIGRYRKEHEKRMRDAQAAALLPLGRDIAAARLGVAVSTAYKMMHRHRRFSTPKRVA